MLAIDTINGTLTHSKSNTNNSDPTSYWSVLDLRGVTQELIVRRLLEMLKDIIKKHEICAVEGRDINYSVLGVLIGFKHTE